MRRAIRNAARTLATFFRLSLVGLILLVTAFRIQAQTPPGDEKGHWTLSLWAAAETGEENTNSFAESQIWSAGAGAGRVLTHERGSGWRRGSLEYAFDVVPVFRSYGNQHVYGGGFDPVMFRWNSSKRWFGFSPYIGGSGGVLLTSSDLPPGKTSSINAMAKAGGGVYVNTRKKQVLDIGVCWSHISNANTGPRNPEFNGIQVSIGYRWIK